MVDSSIAVPATFLINRAGEVVWTHIGETQRDFANIDALEDALKRLSALP